jgi:two-component system phosphate regulon sensor histidine kinase PhoR
VPIRWKITLSAVLAVAVGLVAAGWFVLRSFERFELAHLTEGLAAQTGLAALSIDPLLEQSAASQRSHVAHLRLRAQELSRQASVRVTIIGPDGLVLADSETADDAISRLDNHRTRPEVTQALTKGRGTDIRLSQTTGKRMLYYALPLYSSNRAVLGIVRLAMPMTALEARIYDLERVMGIAFGAALLLAVSLSALLTRGLTRPLSDIASVARQLAAGALDQRIRTTSRDEISVLGATLNHMAERLESTMRAVTEDRAQLLAVLTSMVEGVMVLDCRGKILQLNPGLERMFAIRRTEARGRLYWEVIRHSEFTELTQYALDSRRHQSGEIRLEPSGRILRVEASVAGCQRENEACAVLVFHDVTRLRRLEKVRKDFVANVSHELRTPLTSIRGYVEALIDGAKDIPEEASRFLDIILKQSNRLNLILEDLLQLSQIESGQVLFKRDAVDLRTVVERSVAVIKPLADKKSHGLTVALPDNLPPALGDEERLVQVLTNLLDNAVKYTPEHGVIRIDGRRPGRDRAGDWTEDLVELSVSDNGIGIPEADRPRVFERFYRVDKARSRELGGTGLGLAIVKHIVEGHGGRIWVEGNVPAGSRFVMRLPMADHDIGHEADRPQPSAA